jgi:hypothetical protein
MRPRINIALAALVLAFLSDPSIVLAQSAGVFTPTGDMTTPRSGHTATLLMDGRVLIAGGADSATAELYDPSTGTFAPTGNMTIPRRWHTATLLPDGRVLMAGGFVVWTNSATTSAELYDPLTGTFTAIGDVSSETSGGWHTATLLFNGKVLIVGVGPQAKLYDHTKGSFSETGPYVDPSVAVGTATLLADGKVLITGCGVRCGVGVTEIYDPGTNSFNPTGDPRPGCGESICWFDHVNTGTLWLDGEVLLVGSDEFDWPADAEVYDPRSGVSASIGKTAAPHEFSTATLLPGDGSVLVAGSQLIGGSGDPTAELFGGAGGRFGLAGTMLTPRHSHTATLLPDGTVLIAGGNASWPTPTSTAEIYHPAVLVPAPVLFSASTDGQGAILHATTHQPVSSDNPALAGETLEIYVSGLIDGAVIPPQVVIGGRMAEIVSFGRAVGWTGVTQVNVRVPGGVATGSAVPVRLTYLGRTSNEVTIATQGYATPQQ